MADPVGAPDAAAQEQINEISEQIGALLMFKEAMKLHSQMKEIVEE
jgi:hypothetical protein